MALRRWGRPAFLSMGSKDYDERRSARTGRIWQTLPMPGEREQERDTRGETPLTAESHVVEGTASHHSRRMEPGGHKGRSPRASAIGSERVDVLISSRGIAARGRSD